MSQENTPFKPEVKDQSITEKRDERNAWVEEQKKHDYYYDDAHGYEHYSPEAEDEDEEKAPLAPPAE